jgi:hypothetical protein
MRPSVRGRERQAGLFLHRQRVHVGAQQDRGTGLRTAQRRDPGARRAAGFGRDTEVAECLEHRALGFGVHAQLRVLVEAPAQPNRSREFGARFIVQSVEQRRHGRLA